MWRIASDRDARVLASRRRRFETPRLKGSKDVTPRCTPTRRPHKARIRSAASYAVTQLLHCVIACIAYRRTDRVQEVRTYMVVGSWYGNSTPRPDTNLLDVLVRCGPGRRNISCRNILILIWRRTPRRDAPRDGAGRAMLSRTAARYAPLRDQRTTAAALLVPSYRYRIQRTTAAALVLPLPDTQRLTPKRNANYGQFTVRHARGFYPAAR